MKPQIHTIHFVGIGGIGMSGLAELLCRQGYAISGSDLEDTATTLRLAELGVDIHRGHEARNIGDAQVVVASSAIPADNPELREARSRNISIILRGEMLAEMMRPKNGIAVGGSHGKTTTTSLIGHVLHSAGLDPTSIVGGRVMGDDSSPGGTRLGEGAILVAEADESDGSFLLLNPVIAVITNIDPEHLDHYGDFASLESAFVQFADAVPFWGLAVVCIDHPGARAIVPRLTRRLTTYGFSSAADLVASQVRQDTEGVRFSVHQNGRALGDVHLPLPGDHNVLNALACIAVALELDVSFDEAARGLASFGGVERRYQFLGAAGDIRVVDDYAHHPAELKATLAAARSVHRGRIVSVFQPHRYTRTRDCMQEFATAFDDSDLVIISEIYPAGDSPIPGVSGQVLAEKIADQGHANVRFISGLEAIRDELPKHLDPGDLVLTLGAGDIAKLGGQILQRISDATSSPAEGGE
jgi:UDP-N-acetylmuramate--alanine ligase